MSMVSEALRASGVFQRQRIDIHTRAPSIVLNHLGFSHISETPLSSQNTPRAIRKWYLRVSSLFVERAPRRVVATEEVQGATESVGGWRTVVPVGAEDSWLVWEHLTFGKRNPVEQWSGILRQRIKRWPHNATLVQAQWWIESFVALYQHQTTRGGLKLTSFITSQR